MEKQKSLIQQANETVAVAKAMIVACSHAIGGAPRTSAERAIWELWGKPEFDANRIGVKLTFAMSDEILDAAYHEYSYRD